MKHKFKFTLDMGVYNGKCVHCEQDYRVKSTTQCPEAELCDDIAKRVQSGKIDFVDGSWVSLKPEQEEAKPKVTVADSLSSLFEFMEAMVPELSPETSDELTDEDIDMLKRINKFPIASHIVSELDLPVDQLVSLHKLKRLNYVNLFGGSTDQVIRYHYKVTNKGKEFLKPKPVTLSSYAIGLLVCLSHEHQPTEDFVDDRSINAINQLRSLSMAIRKEHSYIITPRGWEHLQKLLAVPVTIA